MKKIVSGLVLFLIAVDSPAGAQVDFPTIKQQAENSVSSVPRDKNAAATQLQQSQDRVPGFTPQNLANQQGLGNFFQDNSGQLTEGNLNATEAGQFLQQSYNIRPRATVSPTSPLLSAGSQAASGGCTTRQVCAQPTTQVVTTTQQFSCSIQYGETQAQCNYPLPQPTITWRPWLTIQLIGASGVWNFRLSVDLSGDGIADQIIESPSQAQNIYAFDTTGHQIIERTRCTNNFILCSLYWGLRLQAPGSLGWYNAAPEANWWQVNRSSPIINRQTAGGYLKEMVRQALGVPASELRLQAGSEWFADGSCFSLGADRCYSAVWERSYITPAPPLTSDIIQAACGSYMNNTNCSMINEQCTSASCTRSYACIDTSQVIDGCNLYKNNSRCTLQSSGCSLSNQYGQCITREEAYACTTQTIQEGCAREVTQVSCPNSPTIMCLNPEDCFDTSSPKDPNMALAASHMNALKAIQDDHTTNPLVIFRGSSETCRTTIGSNVTRDCCAVDSILLNCSSSEQLLQGHRNASDCVGIGTYCSSKVNLGFTSVCVERTSSFCCFSSKLTRIIQQQGRPQLGIVWGSPQNPDCRGFTPEELQRIDFSRIDFSEYYSDITVKPIDANALKSQTQNSPLLQQQTPQVNTPSGIDPLRFQQDLGSTFQSHAP